MGFLTSYTHIAILLLNLTYDSFKCLNLIKHFKPVFKPGMNGDLCYTIITDCKLNKKAVNGQLLWRAVLKAV